MGKRKDLSEFDKGQIVMARRLDQNISKTAALVGCSRSAVNFGTLWYYFRFASARITPPQHGTVQYTDRKLLLHGQSVCVAGQLGPGPGEMSHTLSGFWDRTGQDRTGQDTSGLNRRREGAGSALQTTRLWSRRTHHVFVLQSGLPPQYDGGRRAPDHSRED
ncbi:hypothetical protein QTP86_006027, partial [Hemibagrus guttatus]